MQEHRGRSGSHRIRHQRYEIGQLIKADVSGCLAFSLSEACDPLVLPDLGGPEQELARSRN